MKSIIRLIPIFFIILSSCKDNNPVGTQNNQGQNIINLEYGDSTKVPSRDGSLQSYNILSNSLTLNYNGTPPNYQVGQILIDSTGTGYCRRITSIQQQGNTLQINTSNASFTDAFKNALIDFKTKPANRNLIKSTRLIKTLRNIDSSYYLPYGSQKYRIQMKYKEANLYVDDAIKSDVELGFTWNILDVSISIKTNNGSVVGTIGVDTLQITGVFGLEFKIKENLWNINYIKFVPYLTKTFGFKNVSASFSLSSGELLNFHTSIVPAFILGVIPMGILVFTIETGTEFGIEVSVTLPVSWEFDCSLSSTSQIGFEADYVNGVPVPRGIFSEQLKPTFKDRGFSGEGSSQVILKPYLEQGWPIKLFDFIGPKFILRPTLPTTISLGNPITANLKAVIEMGVSAELGFSFFHFDAFELTATPFWFDIFNGNLISFGLTTPNLLSPANGSTNQTLTPTLDWSDVTNATMYKLQISTDSNFSIPIINISNLTNSQYYVSTGILASNTKYYWKVKATNNSISSAWSSIWNFTTGTGGSTGGLIAYYPFNGNANDESGNGNNLTNYGATLTTDRFGNNNKAYYFDGTNNYLITQTSNHPTGNVTVTYSAWLYYSSNLTIGQHASVVDVGNSGDSYPKKRSAILIWKNTSYNDLFTYCSQANDHAFYNYNINNNQWIHLVMTKTSTTVKLYINGSFVEQGSIGSGQNVTSTKISIGGSGNFQHANGECLKGKIDDVKIYDRVLTDSEILQLYHESEF
jgi:hypothetical protein